MYWVKINIFLVLSLLCDWTGKGFYFASPTQIETVNENIEKLEEQKTEEKKRMDFLTGSQNRIYKELGEFDSELTEIAQNLTQIEDKRKKLLSDLEILQTEREAVQEKEREYQNHMKMRIRFLYENEDEHFLSLLLQTKSLTAAWDRLVFLSELHDYDRRMLEEYQRLCEDFSWKEEKLKQEEQEVASIEQELYESKVMAQNLINKMKISLLDADNKLLLAEEHADEIETLLASQREYEQELELLKEQEEAAWRAQWEINQQGMMINSQVSYSPVENDLNLLAAIIECEAAGESHEGKLAVGSVVMNRIQSPSFPNSMVEVLYQNRQFTPVGSGRFAIVLARGANSDCYTAASEVLAGKRTLDCLFFRTNNGSKQGIVIGNHVFY